MIEDNRKRYDITCPKCGYDKMQACKSIAHQWGLDSARIGSCLECKTTFRLIYNVENDTMTTEIWETSEKLMEGEINETNT